MDTNVEARLIRNVSRVMSITASLLASVRLPRNKSLTSPYYGQGMRKAAGPQGQSSDGKGPRYIWDLRPTNAAPGRKGRPVLAERHGRQAPMKRAAAALLLAAALAAPASAGGFQVADEGGFASTGRFVELADRYGWASYEVRFRFDLDMEKGRLKPDSELYLRIHKKDGGRWAYRCRAEDPLEMWANVNRLYGKGVSVMTQCRISPKRFAKAVGLHQGLVGEPTLVFHVMVQDGQARPGVQKGIYFLAANDIEHGPMIHYATRHDDPSSLGVLFASIGGPDSPHRRPRFLP